MSSQALAADWVSPPGDTITDLIQERGLSKPKLASSLGTTSESLDELLRGHAEITPGVAKQLASVLGASERFWLNREARYREGLARLRGKLDAQSAGAWVRELPIRDMVKLGWLDVGRSPTERALACLRFFGVPTVEAWREGYESLLRGASFRTSRTFESAPGAVATWIRRGELESSSIPCKRWNPDGLRKALPELRALTRSRKLDEAPAELRRRCAQFGVAVVVVPAPDKCRASGATRLLPRERRLLLLSRRYRSDDQFWFSFFHEVGHLLLHDQKPIFIDADEDDPVSTEEEREANAFAADVLVPPERRSEMFRLPANGRRVMRFARSIGVSPGIVVGQLQFHGRLRPNQLNNLKKRFETSRR